MINTILHARQITKIDDVYMVIGGSHLLNTSHQQQEKTMEAILGLGIKKVGTDITFSEGKIHIDAFEKYDV